MLAESTERLPNFFQTCQRWMSKIQTNWSKPLLGVIKTKTERIRPMASYKENEVLILGVYEPITEISKEFGVSTRNSMV